MLLFKQSLLIIYFHRPPPSSVRLFTFRLDCHPSAPVPLLPPDSKSQQNIKICQRGFRQTYAVETTAKNKTVHVHAYRGQQSMCAERKQSVRLWEISEHCQGLSGSAQGLLTWSKKPLCMKGKHSSRKLSEDQQCVNLYCFGWASLFACLLADVVAWCLSSLPILANSPQGELLYDNWLISLHLSITHLLCLSCQSWKKKKMKLQAFNPDRWLHRTVRQSRIDFPVTWSVWPYHGMSSGHQWLKVPSVSTFHTINHIQVFVS